MSKNTRKNLYNYFEGGKIKGYQSGGVVNDGSRARNTAKGLGAAAAAVQVIPVYGQIAGAVLGIGSMIANRKANKLEKEFAENQQAKANEALITNNNQVAAGNFKDGGDLPVSDTTLKIQGNPSEIDGEVRTVSGGTKVALSHDELVKNMGGGELHAFSSSLQDPRTPEKGKKGTFAATLEPVEKGAAKAQKKLKQFSPNLQEEKNTIKYTEKIAQSAADVQTVMREAKKGHTPRSKYMADRYQDGGRVSRAESTPVPQKGMMQGLGLKALEMLFGKKSGMYKKGEGVINNYNKQELETFEL